eukprot:105752_1
MRDPTTTISPYYHSKFKSIGSSNESFPVRKFLKHTKEISQIENQYIIEWKRQMMGIIQKRYVPNGRVFGAIEKGCKNIHQKIPLWYLDLDVIYIMFRCYIFYWKKKK